MATETVTAVTREKAASDVLTDIAGVCRNIKTLALSAIQACPADQPGQSDEACAIMDTIDLLAGRAGLLADRAAYALTGEPHTMDEADWLHSPRTGDALKVLEAPSAPEA